MNDSMQETYSYVVFVITRFQEGGESFYNACTGSLISALHILAAAHCALSGNEEKYINIDRIRIRVGSNYRKKGLEYDLTALYLHRGYEFGRKLDLNDIMVMLVSK